MRVRDGKLVVVQKRWWDQWAWFVLVWLMTLVLLGSTLRMDHTVVDRGSAEIVRVDGVRVLRRVSPAGEPSQPRYFFSVFHTRSRRDFGERHELDVYFNDWRTSAFGPAVAPESYRVAATALLADAIETAEGNDVEVGTIQLPRDVAVRFVDDLRAGRTRMTSTDLGYYAFTLAAAAATFIGVLTLYVTGRRLRHGMHLARAKRRSGVGRCIRCDYDRGDADPCPECGAPLMAVAVGPGERVWWRSGDSESGDEG